MEELSRVKWWTPTQRIRTVARVPFEAALLVAPPLIKYQEISKKALHLQQLGLSFRLIAQKLGVNDKTVARAIRWLNAMTH